MFVTDVEGIQIEITDFDRALEQVKGFAEISFDPKDNLAPFYQRRKVYWQDFYKKILIIKQPS